MGVNLGVLPTKGLTLPLMSYGGSAILMNMVALAIVLRIDYREPAADARRPRMSATAPRRHGRRHRRPRLPGPRRAPRLRERGWRVQLARHAQRHGEQAGAAARHRVRPHRVRRRARQGPDAHAAPARCACCAPSGSCLRVLRARRADVVLGMGGYITFPGGMMACCSASRWCCVNADAALLLSNKVLLPVARPRRLRLRRRARRDDRHGGRHRQPGARRDRGAARPAAALRRPQRAARLLVVGGSLGAQGAQRVRAAGAGADRAEQRPRVTHQTGAGRSTSRARRTTPPPASTAEVLALHRRHGASALPTAT